MLNEAMKIVVDKINLLCFSLLHVSPVIVFFFRAPLLKNKIIRLDFQKFNQLKFQF